MINVIIQIVMGTVLICGAIAVGISLLRMHRDPNNGNLSDLVTTRRGEKTYLDARKLWEAGAFCTSTWAFVFLTADGKLTEFYFVGYMGSWVGARFLRDREKRITKQSGNG